MSFAAPPQVPKNEQGYGLMTARRRAKLERMLEREIARDATSKRLQAMLGKSAGSSQAVKKTVSPRAFVRGARRDARMDGWTPRGLHLIVGGLSGVRAAAAPTSTRASFFPTFKKERTQNRPPRRRVPNDGRNAFHARVASREDGARASPSRLHADRTRRRPFIRSPAGGERARHRRARQLRSSRRYAVNPQQQRTTRRN